MFDVSSKHSRSFWIKKTAVVSEDENIVQNFDSKWVPLFKYTENGYYYYIITENYASSIVAL